MATTDPHEWIQYLIQAENESEVHRHQNEEFLFYRHVILGDLEAVRQNILAHRFMDHTGVGRLSRDPVQDLKYHFVVSTAVIARLCIDGGMQMEQSYRLSDFYIQKLDDIHSVEMVEHLHERMIIDYTGRMRRIKQSRALSRPLSECINYIYAHLKDRITVDDLAEYTENSASYISRLFKDEMGISASDYIRREKLEAARDLLRYSNFPLIEIANYFSFSSQSHFIHLFQKETGMTPKKYREEYFGTQWTGNDGAISEYLYPLNENTDFDSGNLRKVL